MFSSLGYNSYKHDIVHPSANNMFMSFNLFFLQNYNVRDQWRMQTRGPSALWPCHLTNENVDNKYPKLVSF